MLVGSISKRINGEEVQSDGPSSVKYGEDEPHVNRYDHLRPGLRGPAGLRQEGEDIYPLQELITGTSLIYQLHFLAGLQI